MLFCHLALAHAQPVNTWRDLAAAVAAMAPGSSLSVTVGSHLLVTGGPAQLAANTTLVVQGDPSGCGSGGYTGAAGVGAPALCTLDAVGASPHFQLATGCSLTVSALALVNGMNDQNVLDGQGGAIAGGGAQGVSVVLNNVTLGGNSASYAGGGVYVASGTLAMTSVTATANNGGQFGGVASCYPNCLVGDCCAFAITGSTLSGNQAGGGGALLNYGDVLLTATTVANNYAPYSGGGAILNNGVTVIRGSVLANNMADGQNYGGVLNGNGNLSIYDSAVTGNVATLAGGVAYLGTWFQPPIPPVLLLRNTTVANNTSPGAGAFWTDSSVAVDIADCVFDGNQATLTDAGALVSNGGAPVSILRTSFSRSTAGKRAGAVMLLDDGSGLQVTLQDVGFANCSSQVKGGALLVSGTFADVSFTNVSFTSNTAVGIFARAGGLAVESTGGGIFTCSNCSFAGNMVTVPQLPQSFMASTFAQAAAALDSAFTTASDPSWGDGKGGSLAILNALTAPPLAVQLPGLSCTRNSASAGGCMAVLGAGDVTVTASSPCVVNGNNATFQGAAVFVSASNNSGVTLTACTLAGNTAAQMGGAFAVVAATPQQLAATISIAGGLVVNNTAFGGGALYVAGTNASGGAASVRLSGGVLVDGNTATAGSVWLHDVAQSPLPAATCTPPSCILGASNAAALGGVYATLPSALALSAPATTVTGVPLAVQAALVDGYGQSATSWPATVTLSVHGAAPSANATFLVAGDTNTPYGTPFSGLRLSAAVASVLALTATCADTSALGVANGFTASANVTVAPCPPGSQFAPGMVCVCSPGSSLSANGTCTACPLGSVAPEPGSTVCTPCLANTYASGDGITCLTCPIAGVASRAPAGSTSLADCLCPFGYYPVPTGGGPASSFTCTLCPAGALCDSTLSTVPLSLPGYWHVPHVSTVFYDCAEELCPVREEPPSADGTPAAPNCREGHTGPVCGVCLPGWTIADDVCIQCRPSEALASWNRAALGVFASLMGLTFVVFSATYMLWPLCSSWVLARVSSLMRLLPGGDHGGGGGGDSGVNLKRRAVTMSKKAASVLRFLTVPARLVVEFLQIISSFRRTLAVQWPGTFKAIVGRLNLLNFNFIALPSSACSTPDSSFYQVFNGITIAAALCLVYIAAVWAVGRATIAARQGDAQLVGRFNRRIVSLALFFLTLCFAPITETVLHVFPCRQIGSASYLRADYSKRCDAPEHRRYVNLGIWWACFYIGGIPASYLAVMAYYSIPTVARELRRNAELRALVHLAEAQGVHLPQGGAVDAQLGVVYSQLTMTSITDAQIEALYDAFLASEEAHKGLRAQTTRALHHMTQQGAGLVARLATSRLIREALESLERPRQPREKLRRLVAFSGAHLHRPLVTWHEAAHDPRLEGAGQACGTLYRGARVFACACCIVWRGLTRNTTLAPRVPAPPLVLDPVRAAEQAAADRRAGLHRARHGGPGRGWPVPVTGLLPGARAPTPLRAQILRPHLRGVRADCPRLHDLRAAGQGRHLHNV